MLKSTYPWLAALVLCSPAVAQSVSETTAAPPDADRAAILAMAGHFEVSFAFEETVAAQAGYELVEPYTAEAAELVTVIADTPRFISLQHVLVVTADDGEQHVVKHWRQDWTYEDTELLVYRGHRRFERVPLDPAAVTGTWSQAVFQVDDSPRYEAMGRWTHVGDHATWVSEPTWRPLPRRERSRSDEYHVVVATNRHSITPTGWVHEQDNRKTVLDEQGQAVAVIAHEAGVNHYRRDASIDLAAGEVYWAEHHETWAVVRDAWASALREGSTHHIASSIDGLPLYSHVFGIVEDVHAGMMTEPQAAATELAAVIDASVTSGP